MEKIIFHNTDDAYKVVYHESLQGSAISRFLQNDVNTRNFRVFDRFLKHPGKSSMIVGRSATLERTDDNKIRLSFSLYDYHMEKCAVSSALLSKILWQWAWAIAEKPYMIEMVIDWNTETVKTITNH